VIISCALCSLYACILCVHSMRARGRHCTTLYSTSLDFYYTLKETAYPKARAFSQLAFIPSTSNIGYKRHHRYPSSLSHRKWRAVTYLALLILIPRTFSFSSLSYGIISIPVHPACNSILYYGSFNKNNMITLLPFQLQSSTTIPTAPMSSSLLLNHGSSTEKSPLQGGSFMKRKRKQLFLP